GASVTACDHVPAARGRTADRRAVSSGQSAVALPDASIATRGSLRKFWPAVPRFAGGLHPPWAGRNAAWTVVGSLGWSRHCHAATTSPASFTATTGLPAASPLLVSASGESQVAVERLPCATSTTPFSTQTTKASPARVRASAGPAVTAWAESSVATPQYPR